MNVISIIPARGGSKGVPRKNIRLLDGKPLISHTIKTAIESDLSRVIVSTDDKEIAKIAKEYGAEVPFIRPKDLAVDTATAISVVRHALNYLENEEGYYPDAITYLQPTSPFRKSEHINKGIEMLINSDADSIVGVCETNNHPYLMYKKDKDNKLIGIMEAKEKPERRQDLPVFYILNDALIITRMEYFNRAHENSWVFNTNDMKGLVMDRISSVDINDEFDFKFAEFIISSGLFKLDDSQL